MIGFTSGETSLSEASHRLELIEELYQRYGNTRGLVHKVRYWRKKYSWMMVVGGSRGFKRLVDIAIASIALITLAPLFLIVAMIIKLTDGGAILFWQAP